MLSKENFIEAFKKELKLALGDNGYLESKDVIKNNGVIRRGIVIREKDKNMAPLIYVDALYDAYKDGYSVENLVAQTLEQMKEENDKLTGNFTDFLDYEKMKDKIVFSLINYNRNKNRLKEIPHKRFLDLAVVFRLYLDERDEHQVTAQINQYHMEGWKVSVDEIYAQAMKNCARLQPVRHGSLESFLFGVEEKDDCESHGIFPKLYLMTNTSGIDGASTILYSGEIRRISERFGSDVVILPSSVHEVLLMKYDESMNMKHLGEMVRIINRNDVREQEVLSDSVYIYRRKHDSIEIARDSQLRSAV